MKLSIVAIGIALIVGATTIISVNIASDSWKLVQTQQNKITAVQGCLQASSYQYDNGQGVVSVEPIMDSVEKCMQLKGY